MSADRAVLPVHRDAGKVAHVLIGAGQLVEKGGFAAVLIAHQGKGQRGSIGKRIAGSFGMEAAFLAQPGMLRRERFFSFALLLRGGLGEGDIDIFRVRDHAHVQKMLAEGAVAADGIDPGGLARPQFIQLHG